MDRSREGKAVAQGLKPSNVEGVDDDGSVTMTTPVSHVNNATPASKICLADAARNVIPEIGDFPLRSVRTAHLDELYNNLGTRGGRSGAGLAPKTIYEVHMIVKSAFDEATRTGLTRASPAIDADVPRPHRLTEPAQRSGPPTSFLRFRPQHLDNVFTLRFTSPPRRCSLADPPNTRLRRGPADAASTSTPPPKTTSPHGR